MLALTASAAMLAVAACGSSDPLASGGSTTTSSSAGSIIVGSANFPENALLAEIYAGALTAKGVKVEKTLNIGSREVSIPALKDGPIREAEGRVGKGRRCRWSPCHEPEQR